MRSLGWKPKIKTKKGLSETISWYKKNLINWNNFLNLIFVA
jgi:dTDP-D-glucose 4,6-dehydratase